MPLPRHNWSRPRDIPSPEEDHTWHMAHIAAAQNDRAAFEPLYHRYAADIFDFCRRRLTTEEDAADATSLIFTKVLTALPRFTPHPRQTGATFRGWLFRIARTTLIDLQRTSHPTSQLDVGANLRDPARLPDDLAIARDESDRVRKILAMLPERSRDIIELRLLDFSGQEIADELGITLSAIKSAQYRAMKQLRALLVSELTDRERYLP